MIDDANVIKRFTKKFAVDKNTGCWNWFGSNKNGGYGLFWFDNKIRYAHRISYQIYKDDFVDDLDVLHRCDNPACVNPDHLFLGTHEDNMIDMWLKGRQKGPPSGEANQNAKLTADKVRQIRLLYTQGYNQYQIADLFNVTQANIKEILKRRTWKHVT